MSSYWKAVSFQPLHLAPYCSTASGQSDRANGEPNSNPFRIKGSFSIEFNGTSGLMEKVNIVETQKSRERNVSQKLFHMCQWLNAAELNDRLHYTGIWKQPAENSFNS